MRIGKFVKAPVEVKRYSIDYSEWLAVGETVSTASFSVSLATAPPLTIGSISVILAGLSVEFFVSGGLDANTYSVFVTVTTSGLQTKEDSITFVVRAPS